MGTRRFVGRESGDRQVRRVSETVSVLDQFVRRLRSNGATEDEIASVRDVWDRDDDEWLVTKRQLAKLTDQDLRRLLEHGRREHYVHTHTEDEEAAELRELRYAATYAEWDALGHPLSARHVNEWVGRDPVRAAVALVHERQLEQPRKTVLAYLEPMADTEPLPRVDVDAELAAEEEAAEAERQREAEAAASLAASVPISELPTTLSSEPVEGGIDL